MTITTLKLGPVRTNIRRDFPWWMKVLVPLVFEPLVGQVRVRRDCNGLSAARVSIPGEAM